MNTEEECLQLKMIIMAAYKMLYEVYNGSTCVAYQVAENLEKGLCEVEDRSFE